MKIEKIMNKEKLKKEKLRQEKEITEEKDKLASSLTIFLIILALVFLSFAFFIDVD